MLFKLYRYVQNILSGDIETSPGPGLSKPKCQVCDKAVRCNQKCLVCKHCLEMCHVKCSNHQLNQNASNKVYGLVRIVYILHFRSTAREM